MVEVLGELPQSSIRPALAHTGLPKPKKNEKPRVFEGVELKIVDSGTDFNDFVSRLCRNGRGMIFDHSYTVFNDFALAKEGAQDRFGGVGRT